jgi:hypothetical protein
MRFWQLTNPDYESDYEFSYVNGSLEHPYGLPGLRCDVCGETWGASRILPWQCPQALQSHENLRDGWPVSLQQHRALVQLVRDEFARTGVAAPDLKPGDKLPRSSVSACGAHAGR